MSTVAIFGNKKPNVCGCCYVSGGFFSGFIRYFAFADVGEFVVWLPLVLWHLMSKVVVSIYLHVQVEQAGSRLSVVGCLHARLLTFCYLPVMHVFLCLVLLCMWTFLSLQVPGVYPTVWCTLASLLSSRLVGLLVG